MPVRRETIVDQAKIGKFLQELRKERGLTQEQLAERFFVARRTVSRWETGANMPDLDILVKLSDFYDVELRELLDGERRDVEMDKETQETVLKVAEYSSAREQRSKKVVLAFFVLGIIALVISMVLDDMGVIGTPQGDFAKGMTYGVAAGVMVLGILYTTGALARFQGFKTRLLGRR